MIWLPACGMPACYRPMTLEGTELGPLAHTEPSRRSLACADARPAEVQREPRDNGAQGSTANVGFAAEIVLSVDDPHSAPGALRANRLDHRPAA